MMTTLNNRVSALFADPLHAAFRGSAESPQNRSLNKIDRLAPMSVWEADDAIHVQMDLPGVSIDDVDVGVEKNRLTIRGHKKAPDHSYQYQERCFGEFERSLQLEEWIDQDSVEATFTDGVLHVRLAKKAVARRINIPISRQNGDAKRIESHSQ